MEMRRIKKTLLVLIALGLIVSLTMVIPASAKTSPGSVEVTDSELVLATIDSAGAIEEVQVVDWLGLKGDGSVEVKEKKAFDEETGYQGIHSFTKPKVEGDYIVWPEQRVSGNANVLAMTKLSESMVEEARTRIPLDLDFKYWFDGDPVSDLDTITGKDGHFKLELTLKNTSKETTEVEYEDPATGGMKTEEVETYLPLVIQPYDWYFDNTIFYNLEADPTGLVVWMPEMYNVGWSIPLFPPATEDSHTIWVEADVKNFQMPTLTLAAAFVFPETNQINQIPIFKAGLEQLYDGVKQLSKGVGDPATPDTLLFGITAIDSGLKQMAAPDGIPLLASGVNEMIPGVQEAIAGIGSPSNPQSFIGGTSQIIGGLQGIAAGIGSADTGATLLYALDQMRLGMLKALAGIGDASASETLLNAAYQIIGGLQLIHYNLADPGNANSIYNAVMGAYQQFKDPLTSGTVRNLVDTSPTMSPAEIAVLDGTMNVWGGIMNSAAAGITTIYDNIGDGSSLGLQYAANAVYGGLDYLKINIGSAATPDTLLWAVDQVSQGLSTIKNQYIGSTANSNSLLGGVAAIQNGLYQMKAGLTTGDPDNPGLLEGLILISGGLDQVISGLGSESTPDTAIYGTTQLTSGLTQVGGGTKQMEDALADTLGMLNMSEAELEVIAQRGEEFDHFLGRAQDAENNVRFVFQMKPTYNYKTGSSSSWIVAIVLSVIIAILLVAGGILLGRRVMA